MSRQFFTDSVNKCKIIEYKNDTTIIKKKDLLNLTGTKVPIQLISHY